MLQDGLLKSGLNKTVIKMNQMEAILEWKHLFRKASLEHNKALEETALKFRKEIEHEFDIDTAELVEIAYKKRAEQDD